MSATQQVSCQNCGEAIHFTTWQTLNTSTDPDAKTKLINGSLFSCSCPKCGKTMNIIYPVVYHDTEHKMIIMLVIDNEATQDFHGAIENIQSGDAKGKLKNYRFRIVRDINVLREKVIIMNMALDDRFIELVKLVYAIRLKETTPDLQIHQLFFYATNMDDMKIIAYLADGQLSEFAFDEEKYRQFVGVFGEAVDVSPADEYEIDQDWAKTVSQGIL